MSGNELTRGQQINRVRRTATGILLVMFAVFLATFLSATPSGPVQLIRAMAEAGMVGGIADWFAVEALFRRPLGLPIPHTALLPNNQKRAADNIARFVDENFLTPERLIGQIRDLNLIRRLAGWLQNRDNARLIGRELAEFLHLVLRRQVQAGLGDKAGRFLSKSLQSSLDSGLLADRIAMVLKDTVHGDLLDQILLRVRKILDGNRDKVAKLVQDRSRWWIASTVDNKIVAILVDGMLSVVDELSEESSPLRGEFERAVEQVIEDLRSNGALASYLDQGLAEFGQTPAYQTMLGEMIQSVLAGIEKDMAANPERFGEMLAGAIADFAQHVHDTPALQKSLDERLLVALEALLAELRPAAVHYISRTIAEWDPDELVARMETEVGRDLQFIRINGSVLGAMIGGLIFLATQLLEFL